MSQKINSYVSQYLYRDLYLYNKGLKNGAINTPPSVKEYVLKNWCQSVQQFSRLPDTNY